MTDEIKPKNNQWFHDILNHGLATFIEYWGYEKIAKRWDKGGSITFSQSDIRRRVEELQGAQDYDPSGITTYMLLRAYMHDLLQSTSYTASDLILNWDNFRAGFEKIALMRADLEEPEALEILKGFEEEVIAMARQYKAKDLKIIEQFARDPIESAFLRQSAYKAVEKSLHVHQFLQGAGATGPLKVHQKIYEFWNINSLINAAAHQIFDGAALCLIRDSKSPMASFFCFAIKAGETLTILTDREKGAHPRYHEMTRRPDRDMEKRWNQHWFPYDLLDIEVTADGKELYLANRASLVRYNASLVPLADIGELHPQEVIWLGLMLDLIGKKYGSENPVLLPEISYTGEMIRYPDALVPGESSLIVQGKYKPIELPKITAADLDADKIANNFDKPSYGHNRHLFDRFKDQVPSEVFNLIGEKELKLLRDSNEALGKKEYESEFMSHFPETYTPEIDEIELRYANPLDFGSPEELDKDRKWNARFNQISVINHLVSKEYEAKKDKICQWFETRVRANEAALVKYITLMECNVFCGLWKSSHIYRNKTKTQDDWPFPHEDEAHQTVANILDFEYNEKDQTFGPWSKDGSVRFGGWKPGRYPSPRYQVSFHDQFTRATIGATFRPKEASHLALLAGCEVTDLPIQIRYWNKEKPYVGNSILDRLDPEDWYLRDPWRELDFTVTFCIAKSYFNKLRKDAGLPRHDFKAPKKR